MPLTQRTRRLWLLGAAVRSEEHTSELQSQSNLVCRLLLEKKKKPPRSDRKRIHRGEWPGAVAYAVSNVVRTLIRAGRYGSRRSTPGVRQGSSHVFVTCVHG